MNPAAPEPIADADASPSALARQLGYGGLIPFVVLAALLWFTRQGERPWASSALVGYGAVIISFLGAIHWGLAMRERRPHPAAQQLWGIAPSLAGWGAALVGSTTGLLLIATSLWFCFFVDRVLYERGGLQAWLPMRLRLTIIASASCLAASGAMMRQP